MIGLIPKSLFFSTLTGALRKTDGEINMCRQAQHPALFSYDHFIMHKRYNLHYGASIKLVAISWRTTMKDFVMFPKHWLKSPGKERRGQRDQELPVTGTDSKTVAQVCMIAGAHLYELWHHLVFGILLKNNSFTIFNLYRSLYCSTNHRQKHFDTERD